MWHDTESSTFALPHDSAETAKAVHSHVMHYFNPLKTTGNYMSQLLNNL